MKKINSFMQMFSVSGVGGGGVGAHLDFHADTHHMVSKTDYGKQTEAREESKHNSSKSSISTDRDGFQHIYSGGSELASNDSSGAMDRSGETSYG